MCIYNDELEGFTLLTCERINSVKLDITFNDIKPLCTGST